jgi:glycosyltransferase involved in cell wall biosynthesis
VPELVERPLPAPADERLATRKRIAIVPAFNEEATVGSVIDEIHALDPGFEVVVVDDGSSDRTAAVAAEHGAHVLKLPFNLGIGGAMQTGYRYAWENGFDLAVQIDGDGQHDPTELLQLVEPVLEGRVDMAVGTRFAGKESYRPPLLRRLAIGFFARTISLLVRQRVTDTTSGFRAVNRRGIALFARDYPHDYPEVEATVMVVKHRLQLCEVAVHMRERRAGRSSIGALSSIYYMIKVLLAVFVAMFRRYAVPTEEDR